MSAALSALAIGALDYAACGLAVLPCAPRGKVPAIRSAHPKGDPLHLTGCTGACGRDGHGLHDASTDLARVAAWWAAMPDANIGLRTGLLFDVIDIDGKTGIDSLVAHLAAGQDDLPPSYGASRTPGTEDGPGAHLFVAPSGHSNGAKLLPGLDYRGVNGYVIAPPSVRPSGTYEWTRPLELPTVAGDPGPVLAFLLSLAPERVARPSPAGAAAPLAGPDRPYRHQVVAGDPGRRLAGLVQFVLDGTVGERNVRLYWAACRCAEMVTAGELAVEVAVDALLLAAEAVGLEPTAARRTVDSGLGSTPRARV